MADGRLISPSGAHRWVRCPGSVAMSSKYPRPEDDEDDIHSAEGRAAHKVAELCLRGGNRPSSSAGKEVMGQIVTSDIINSVSTYVAKVAEIGAGIGSFGIDIERRTDIAYLGIDGTIDALLYSLTSRTMPPHLFDFKHGRRFVDAAENLQGICYMIGLVPMFPWAPGFNFTICQPRNYDADGPVRSCYYSLADLERWAVMIKAAADAVRDGSGQCHAGPHCYRCTAAHACVTFSRFASMWYDFAECATPQELTGPELGLEIQLVKDALDTLQNREKALVAQAEARIAKGDRVQGWCIEDSYSRTEWRGDHGAIGPLLELTGIDAWKPRELKTPKQALDMGADPDTVKALAGRHRIGMKLVRDTLSREKRLFA